MSLVQRFASHVKLPSYADNGFAFAESGLPDLDNPAPLAEETSGVVTDSEGIAWIWDSVANEWRPQSPVVWFLDNFPHDTTARLKQTTWYYIAGLGEIPFQCNLDITWVWSVKRIVTSPANGLQEWYPMLSVSRDAGATWVNPDSTTVRVRPWPSTTTEQRPCTLMGTWRDVAPATDFRVRLRMISGGGGGSSNYLNGKVMVIARPYTEDVESTAAGPG